MPTRLVGPVVADAGVVVQVAAAQAAEAGEEVQVLEPGPTEPNHRPAQMIWPMLHGLCPLRCRGFWIANSWQKQAKEPCQWRCSCASG